MIKALIFSLSPPPLYIWRQWSSTATPQRVNWSRIFVKTLRLRKDNVRPAVRDQVCGSACLRQGPGLMVRCTAYEHVLFRRLNAAHHVCLDMRGMTYVRFYAPEVA